MVAWLAAPALGCGGFFCDSVEPVEQSGERILFREETEGEWTAFVEVQFRGPPIDFAWVVPIPRVLDPETEIDVADPGLFDALEAVTAPRFVEERYGEAQASYAEMSMGCGCGPYGGDAFGVGAIPDTSGVEVVGEAVVGPYAVEVITAEEGTNLAAWLQGSGYAIPYSAWPLMDHYLDEGYAFLGVKLRPDVPEGPVDTLVLRCGAERPEIPLILTAVAASRDMPITAYVLAEERYAPAEGWDELEPDWSAVRWTGEGQTNYDLQLLDAMREAGRAWVTEYAQPAERLVAQLDPDMAAILDHGAYLTRLKSYVSPEYMTLDPVFLPDPEGPDVDNVHVVAPLPASLGWSASLGALLLGLAGAGLRRRLR